MLICKTEFVQAELGLKNFVNPDGIEKWHSASC